MAEQILKSYFVYKLLDIFMVAGTIGLGICYIIARYYNHVSTFCYISSLVVYLPERIIFRINFSIVGSLLAFLSLPIYYVLEFKGFTSLFTKIGPLFQFLSGMGVIMVAACGPKEIESVHIIAAVLGFGGSALAQCIYNFIFYNMDHVPNKKLFRIRILLTIIFMLSAICLGLCEKEIWIFKKRPWGAILEWSLWFNLLIWYYSLKYDLKDLSIGLITNNGNREANQDIGKPLLECKNYINNE